MLIGLISDTHGLLRPEALRALRGVALILHAGDVGGREVLARLRDLAPVRAVAGNVDDPADPDLEHAVSVQAGTLRVHVTHGHELGNPTPEKLLVRYPADVLVYGHTHRALVHRTVDRLVVNPGAAGPRRFDLKPSVALLTIEGGDTDVRIVPL